MYLVQQFCVGEFPQSEALAEFRFVVFFQRIPPWQNDAFTSLTPHRSGERATNSIDQPLLIGH